MLSPLPEWYRIISNAFTNLTLLTNTPGSKNLLTASLSLVLMGILHLCQGCSLLGFKEEARANNWSELKSAYYQANKEAGFEKTGKLKADSSFQQIYALARLDTFDLPVIDGKVFSGLRNQVRLLRTLRQPAHQDIGNLRISTPQMEAAAKLLLEWQFTRPVDLFHYLDAYQIQGEDKKGNVYMTGYFTPVLKAQKEPSKNFIYPIYSCPENWVGPLPTRRQIDGPQKALSGRNQEIAYVERPEDIYYMQVQGSGFIEFSNGKTQYLAFDCTNRQPYRSIGKYMMKNASLGYSDISISGIKSFLMANPHLRDTVLFQNPSYTFFTPKGNQPLGAGTIPLIAGVSAAVDRSFIPLGSVLIAAIPVFDENQKVVGHEYRYLLAQDIGGQINGPGHIDIYWGTGEEASQLAEQFHHYGRLWILLPKPQT